VYNEVNHGRIEMFPRRYVIGGRAAISALANGTVDPTRSS